MLFITDVIRPAKMNSNSSSFDPTLPSYGGASPKALRAPMFGSDGRAGGAPSNTHSQQMRSRSNIVSYNFGTYCNSILANARLSSFLSLYMLICSSSKTRLYPFESFGSKRPILHSDSKVSTVA